MTEQYVLEKAFDDTPTPDFDIRSRRVIQIPDSNNGSYSNEVTFDLTAISNAGSYLDWLNSWIQIPLVLVEKASGARAGVDITPEGAMSCSLKNGHFSIFNGMTLRLSNTEIIPFTNFNNMRISYEVMSSFSDLDMNKSITYGLVYEDVLSTEMIPINVSGAGTGVVATDILLPATANAYKTGNGSNYPNLGRLKRLNAIIDMVTYGTLGISGSLNVTRYSSSMNESTVKTLKQSYFGYNDGQQKVWYLMAKLPFSLLHDYFRQCPLTKNSLYSLTLYLHTNVKYTETMTGTAGGTTNKTDKTFPTPTSANFTIQTPYNFLPLQSSGLQTGNGSDGYLDAATTRSFYLSIAKVHSEVSSSVQNAPAHFEQNCKINCHMVTLSPEKEAQYLQNPRRIITYQDTLQPYHIQDKTGGSSIQQVLSTSTSRIRKIFMMPYYNGSGLANIGLTTTGTPTATILPFTSMTSPYSSFGNCALADPGAWISQWQVYIAGANFYPSTLSSADEFYFEYCKSTLNGSICCSDFKNGQIDFTQYINGNQIIVCDMSNYKAKSDDDIPKQISISFQNASRLSCNYLVWVQYERQIIVDVEMGNIVISTGRD